MKKTKENRASFCVFIMGCNARWVVLGLTGCWTEDSFRAANSTWAHFATARMKSTGEIIGHILKVSVFALGLGDIRGDDMQQSWLPQEMRRLSSLMLLVPVSDHCGG